jgi:hypothetical protein
MRETKSQKKERTEQIVKLLKRAHPDAHCALSFKCLRAFGCHDSFGPMHRRAVNIVCQSLS